VRVDNLDEDRLTGRDCDHKSGEWHNAVTGKPLWPARWTRWPGGL